MLDKRLSVQSFGWKKGVILEAVMKDKTAPVFLCRFIGLATGTRPYVDPNGDRAEGLRGQFEGTGPDGEVKEAAVIYLPGYINEQIISALEVAKAGGGRDVGVPIAMDIYAQWDEDSATSYVFMGSQLGLETAESSAVDRIKSALAEKMPPLPSLPAPAKGKAS